MSHERQGAGPRERTIAHMRRILATSGAAGAIGIVACECGTVVCDPLPSPTPPGAACTRTVVLAPHGALAARTVASEPFSTGAAGRLEVTVDWTFPSSEIGVYVVSGSCSPEALAAGSCTLVLESGPSGAKPRRAVSTAVVAPGAYTLFVANDSARDESVALQVVLAQGDCTT